MSTVLGEHKGRPCVLVESRPEWRAWLAEHHATSGTIWLARWKKGSGRPHLEYDDLVEEALCFGWIDSTVNAYDEDRSVVLVAPRKKGGTWSRVNKERLVRLEAAGLLAPPGIAVIEAAKADGSWSLLDDAEALVVPPDLAAGLAAHAELAAVWDAQTPGRRKVALSQLALAKTDATRRKRLDKILAMLGEGRLEY
ncbi:MAG: YdeI/OmpD-associated family protein [Microthrixaceae bacterium]